MLHNSQSDPSPWDHWTYFMIHNSQSNSPLWEHQTYFMLHNSKSNSSLWEHWTYFILHNSQSDSCCGRKLQLKKASASVSASSLASALWSNQSHSYLTAGFVSKSHVSKWLVRKMTCQLVWKLSDRKREREREKRRRKRTLTTLTKNS